MKSTLLVFIACSALSACEKQGVKFQPGDRVRIRVSDTKGVVYLRLSPAVEDLYYLAIPGLQPGASGPTDEVSDRAKSSFWWKADEPWHTQGPYYDTDLERMP